MSAEQGVYVELLPEGKIKKTSPEYSTKSLLRKQKSRMKFSCFLN